jgi:hypothetical protein
MLFKGIIGVYKGETYKIPELGRLIIIKAPRHHSALNF